MGSLSLRIGQESCPHCLGGAQALVGEAAGAAFRVVRCAGCGDAVAETIPCPLCDSAADRFAISRPLRAVYRCSGGCVPFAFDAIAEESIRRPEYAGARQALQRKLREDGRRATYPVLITARIIEDYRASLEEDGGAAEGPALR